MAPWKSQKKSYTPQHFLSRLNKQLSSFARKKDNKYINQSAESDVGLDATARAASELLGSLCELRESVLRGAGVAQE